jgi:hypothetical protein
VYDYLSLSFIKTTNTRLLIEPKKKILRKIHVQWQQSLSTHNRKRRTMGSVWYAENKRKQERLLELDPRSNNNNNNNKKVKLG